MVVVVVVVLVVLVVMLLDSAPSTPVNTLGVAIPRVRPLLHVTRTPVQAHGRVRRPRGMHRWLRLVWRMGRGGRVMLVRGFVLLVLVAGRGKVE
jgi:hypothetical protein